MVDGMGRGATGRAPGALAGLLALLALALAAGWWCSNRGRGYRAAAATTSLPSLRADILFVDASAVVTRGPPRLVVLRLQPSTTLVPHHFRAHGLTQPLTVEGWADKLGAAAVFNSGQFTATLQYIGWLKSGGRWLSPRRKAPWMGLLVSAPRAGRAQTQLLDLALAKQDHVDAIAADYENVVQSMMLLDDKGVVRVRRSDLTACRTVVAQDGQGRILVLVTEGATTLYDLARWLPHSGLDIRRAINLDGGIEAQLAIRTPELRLAMYGQYGISPSVFAATQLARGALPAVIAVHP